MGSIGKAHTKFRISGETDNCICKILSVTRLTQKRISSIDEKLTHCGGISRNKRLP